MKKYYETTPRAAQGERLKFLQTDLMVAQRKYAFADDAKEAVKFKEEIDQIQSKINRLRGLER